MGSVAVVVSVALTAGIAHADTNLGATNGITYVSDQTTITPGQPAAPEASCPAGTKLLGGAGVSASGQNNGILAGLRPEDSFDDTDSRPDDGITAFGFNNTNVSTSTIVWAFCGLGSMRYPSKARRLDIQETRTMKVHCPDETRVLSGGFTTEGSNSDLYLNATQPYDDGDRNKKPEDGWKVRTTNVAGFDNKRVTAWAFCRHGNLRPLYPDLDNLGGVGANAGGGVGGSCVDQTVSLIGAGGVIRGEPTLRRIVGLRPSDNTSQGESDSIPDDTLVAEARNDSAPGTGTAPLGAHAICATFQEPG